MMNRAAAMICAALCAVMIASPAPSATKVPALPLAPVGPWVVHNDENMCLLERAYPLGGTEQTLVFQPLLDLPSMEVFVLNRTRSDEQSVGTFTARIEPGTQTFTGRYFSAVSPKTKSRVTRLTIDRGALDQLKDGDTFHVQAKPVDLAFRIVRPDKARVALQTCITNLKKAWGVDPDAEAKAVTQLEGNPGRYFGVSDYPPEAVREGIYGRVVALLNIGVDGSVTNCRIVSSAGAALNAGTCKAALKVRFKPPRDKDGKSLTSTYLLPVRWVLPGSPQL